MKILEIIPNFELAGAENMCCNLCCALKAQGHTPIAVSMYSVRTALTDRMEKEGIKVIFLDKKPGKDFSMPGKIYRVIKEEKPDIIHVHLIIVYCILACILKRPKIVQTIHTMAHKETKKRVIRFNYLFIKLFGVTPVALSNAVKDSIVSTYHVKAENVPVIYNGIPLYRCLQKQYYAFSDTINIVHVGRFALPKNHINMLRAIKALHEKHPEVVLHMYGDGELRDEISAFITENGMADYALMHGKTDNVYPVLHDADIFILPSVYEGIPMTIIEAMGTGLPIVASAVGGIPDMIDDGKTGLLCTPEPDDIAAKTEMFIADEDLRRSCGQAAVRAAERFSADEMAREYVKVFEYKTKKRRKKNAEQ